MFNRRWAPLFGILNWHIRPHHHAGNRLEAELLPRLSQHQITNKTTRGLTPGLINPRLGPAGGEIPYPNVKFPHRRKKVRQGSQDEGSSEEQDVLTDKGQDTVSDDEEDTISDEELLDTDAGSSAANEGDHLTSDWSGFSSSDEAISDVEENTELAEESHEAGSSQEIALNTEIRVGSEIKADEEDESNSDARDRNTSRYAGLEAEVEEITREHFETGPSRVGGRQEDPPK